MIDVTSTVQNAIKQLRALPGKVERALLLQVIKKSSEDVRDEMRKPGSPVRYPIQWDTEKQRKKVMATLRRQNNLPYRPTGAHANAWESRPIDGGYQTENIGHQAVFLNGVPSGELSGAAHVTSSGQSHIHAGRRPLVKRVVDRILARMPERIAQALKSIRVDGQP